MGKLDKILVGCMVVGILGFGSSLFMNMDLSNSRTNKENMVVTYETIKKDMKKGKNLIGFGGALLYVAGASGLLAREYTGKYEEKFGETQK
ncbi:MAG TPA: hypothetical protein ENG87_05220 [Candidatus Pacearchaeota archaeon]|nr:hypothetical protein BMS3Abin17_01105 [archaeon BMS3Abin17]HDK42758.1 hypothetical protein [Candidatus Pacearchaeota archaeon]HDZ60123.1 hypothetical protein [Candidatus Pacearchaeota archaeon]